MKTQILKTRFARFGFSLWLCLAFCTSAPQSMAQDSEAIQDVNQLPQFIQLLDSNSDQTLDPYEALDSLLRIEAEMGEAITATSLNKMIEQMAADRIDEVESFLEEMDQNNDGKVELDELDQEMRGFAQMFDKNNDDIISAEEALQADSDMADEMFLSQEEIDEEVELIFEELDSDRDDILIEAEADDELSWEQIREGDSNGDARVTKEEFESFLTADNSRAAFQINGDTATMSGVINADTPAKVLELVFEHPNVRTIVMKNVPGSIDDESNLRAARYVRRFSFTTIIESNGSVASGGTDFFLAGSRRIVEPGGKLGIHSWGGPGFQGKDVPEDDPQHQLYLKYYDEMGIPASFYWRTLEAAPANDIHWMTEAEIIEYNVRTENTKAANAQQPEESATQETIRATRIHKVTDDFPNQYRQSFDRYIQVIAPNNKPINIFAQKEISDSQLRHVRDVMLHYLKDFPGSEFGASKAAIANQMANNRAIMMVCKGHDGQYREPRIPAQPLYADETIVEGSSAYMNNEFEEHRDATLEEILHCVHDNGIGVDVSWAPKGVAPDFQKEIRAATTHAMKNKIWPTANAEDQVDDWIEELREEGSLTQEYLASVIDSYYGLWGPFDEDFGMWGIYAAKTRNDVKAKDPNGFAVVEKFFHPYLTYQAEIDSSFEGTFSMSFDRKSPYTHKSQYLRHARLTGQNDSNLTGNDQDNTLVGNSGNNVLDGGLGRDRVVFPNAKSDYEIKKNDDGTLTVIGDGKDTLISIEELVFDGAKLDEAQFVDPVPHNLRMSHRQDDEDDEDEGTDDGADAMAMAKAIIAELDQNSDGQIQRTEVPEEDRDQFDHADGNGDGSVTMEELLKAIEEEQRDGE